MKISEIMTVNVKTARPEEDARSVYRKFVDLGIHHIPVVEGGRTVGMLSTTDYRGVIHGGDKGNKITADMVFGGVSVGSLMTPNPMTLPPDAPVSSAASLMLEYDIHAVPIVKDGALAGIVTSNDILEAVSEGKIKD